MPLIQDGEGYRSFSEPSTFEAETETQVRQIEYPTDKAFAFVGDPEGSVFSLWRFNATSTAGASSVVLIPINPLFAAIGRWIKMPVTGGGGTGGAIIGSGPPEGVVTADPGQFYWDDDPVPDGQGMYLKVTGSGNIGWVLQYQFGE